MLRYTEQKRTYDRSAYPLKPLKPNQTVRMQTPHGHNKLDVVVRSSGDTCSYIVIADGMQYCCIRCHLPVAEPLLQSQSADDFSTSHFSRTRIANQPENHPDHQHNIHNLAKVKDFDPSNCKLFPSKC